MKDDLGDRIKRNYENRTRYYLPRRTYTVVRVDGKTFHTYTRGLQRPFDTGLMEDMDKTAVALCQSVTGCVFAFVQSDEISLLLTDFDRAGTEAWFDGNVQKISSLSASQATAAFNRLRWMRQMIRKDRPISVKDLQAIQDACFDARAFTIPDVTEVENYFIWRQQDATRNSISMAASSVYSTSALYGKSVNEMQEMLWQSSINWNDYPGGCKRGRVVVRVSRQVERAYTHGRTGAVETASVERSFWQVEVPPIFTRERNYLMEKIPRLI